MNKIAYFNLIMQGHEGIAKKLYRQATAVHANGIPMDFYCLPGEGVHYQLGDPLPNFQVVTMPGRNAFAMRFHQAAFINRVASDYQAMVLRYPLWDPVLPLFLKNKSRIFLEHHTKEIPELKLSGDKRWLTETLFGGRYLRAFAGSLGVTREIVEYEKQRSGQQLGCAFPNGIDTASSAIPVSDQPLYQPGEPVNYLFVASNFTPWYGLEEVLEAWSGYSRNKQDQLHIVGNTFSPQQQRAENLPGVRLHGVLSSERITRLYGACQLGLSSFRLERAGLREASTLKVREYMLAGLPVVSGHVDTAFPDSFTWYRKQGDPDFDQMYQFVLENADARRTDIRQAALPFIDIAQISREVYAFVTAHSGVNKATVS